MGPDTTQHYCFSSAPTLGLAQVLGLLRGRLHAGLMSSKTTVGHRGILIRRKSKPEDGTG